MKNRVKSGKLFTLEYEAIVVNGEPSEKIDLYVIIMNETNAVN